jgi:uncharacterized protein
MFWDASALVPCLVQEDRSADNHPAFLQDDAVTIWWGTAVECASALERRRRAGMPEAQYNEGYARLLEILRLAAQVLPNGSVRNSAMELLRRHQLRASDALQLAAALSLSEPGSFQVELVCLDEQLRKAAQDEGLFCIPR